MRVNAKLIASTAALLLSGCISSTFVLTDGRAIGRPHTNPGFYIDRLPPAPYYSIGIIEVKAPSGSTLDVVAEEALRRGGEEGCDYVIDRAIYRVTLGIPGVRAVVAQVGAYPAVAPPPQVMPVYGSSAPASMREFVCAIATQPGTAATTPAAAPAAVPAVRSAHVTAAVNARTAPSDAAPSATTLAAGQTLQVLGAPPRDGWLSVKLTDGRVAYVHSDAVAFDAGH